MKLLPGEPLAPFRRLPDRFRVDAVLGAEQLDVGVGGHLAQNLRHVLRAFHVHGAPPEGRLRAPERREPAVVAEHAAYLGVDGTLDTVVRRRQRAIGCQVRVEVGEQRP